MAAEATRSGSMAKAPRTSPSVRQLTTALKERNRGAEGAVLKAAAATGLAGLGSHLDCLKAALQSAVTLEFATLPPYLSALWSIKNEQDPVAKSIREVAHEEMLHMALAANMLSAIGGSPQINQTVPEYPGPLPGGVHAGLIAKLSCLTRDALKDFMWIERPVGKLPPEEVHPFDQPAAHWDNVAGFEADETIGEFYDAIDAAFVRLQPDIRPDHQVTGPLAWMVVTSVGDVTRAIQLIKDQGEGSATSPKASREELSHFYRFLEMYEGRKLIWDPAKQDFVRGDELPFPDVWPMAVVPKGGYPAAAVPTEVAQLLEQSDVAYSRMLDLLQDCWRRGGQASFVHAIEAMFELQKSSRALMQIPIPGGGGATYGPCFRYRPSSS